MKKNRDLEDKYEPDFSETDLKLSETEHTLVFNGLELKLFHYLLQREIKELSDLKNLIKKDKNAMNEILKWHDLFCAMAEKITKKLNN